MAVMVVCYFWLGLSDEILLLVVQISVTHLHFVTIIRKVMMEIISADDHDDCFTDNIFYDYSGRTALHIAIENENIDMVECLLKKAADVGDALLHAINEENVEAVELILDHEEGRGKPLEK